jgi:hypothetical protein
MQSENKVEKRWCRICNTIQTIDKFYKRRIICIECFKQHRKIHKNKTGIPCGSSDIISDQKIKNEPNNNKFCKICENVYPSENCVGKKCIECFKLRAKPKKKYEHKKCEHSKRPTRCTICNGKEVQKCEHNKLKINCNICDGRYSCEHGKSKYICIKCIGSQICEHGKRKKLCFICDGQYLCKSEWCDTHAKKKYEGYCLRCFIHLFPHKPQTRNYKTKERAVVAYITELYSQYFWSADKTIPDGCSGKRPDLILDLGTHVIIVEIDENKHSGYNCSCENKRLMELSKDLDHRNMIMIRFNPDSYVDNNGNKISSCWKINNRTNILVINPTKKDEWLERLNSLKLQIDYWLINIPGKMVETVELFY